MIWLLINHPWLDLDPNVRRFPGYGRGSGVYSIQGHALQNACIATIEDQHAKAYLREGSRKKHVSALHGHSCPRKRNKALSELVSFRHLARCDHDERIERTYIQSTPEQPGSASPPEVFSAFPLLGAAKQSTQLAISESRQTAWKVYMQVTVPNTLIDRAF